MKITGIVLDINKHTAFVLTKQGEFKKVKIRAHEPPNIGQEYTGRSTGFSLIKGHVHPYRYIFISVIIVFLISVVGFIYNYFSPSYSAILDVSPSFEIKCNSSNKVINISSEDSRGYKILNEINVKNASLNDSLIKIINQCKKDDIINPNYQNKNKTMRLYISGKNIDLSSLKKYIKTNSLNLQINVNGNN